MDLIDGLKAFVATAQTGSFTEAADRLGISNRLTSKYVAELENRIGARLLQRTTRRVGVSPVGVELLARAPALLDELDDMLRTVSEESRGVSGLLRISAPVAFGEIYVKALLSRFAAHHPEIAIDLRLDDAYVDLAADGFDLAFRVGIPQASSLKVRKLGMISSRLVASPEYLARNGTPERPQDLLEHVCIIDTNRRDPRWTFINKEEEIIINPKRIFMVNSARVARDWAMDGWGISLCPEFVLTKEVADGRLVPLLESYGTRSYPFNVIYLEGNILPRKVRALIDFAIEDVKTSELL